MYYHPMEAGEVTIHATAYYWTTEATPTDLNEITKKENTINVQIKKKGDVGEAAIDLADGYVIERGTLLDIPVTPGTNAQETYVNLRKANGSPVLAPQFADGHILLPTWDLAAGEYILGIECSAEKYASSYTTIGFAITENNWSKPTSPICYARTSAGEVTTVDTAEPFDLVVYIPDARSYSVKLLLGEKQVFYDYSRGETLIARNITINNSGTVKLKASNDIASSINTGMLDVEEFLTVREGRDTIPELTLTCDREVLVAGDTFKYKVTSGQWDQQEDHSGVHYVLSLRQQNSTYDFLTSEIVPDEDWHEIDSNDDYLSNYFNDGSRIEINVKAYGRGFEGKSATKTILVVGSEKRGETDNNFRVSIDGMNQEGSVEIPKSSSYTVQMTGLPGTARKVLIYSNALTVYQANTISGQVTLYAPSELMEDLPLIAAYVDSAGKYHYSNTLHLTIYSNGTLDKPEVTANLTEGQDGTYSIAQGTTIECQLTNPEEYAGKGDVQIYYELIDPEQGDYGHIRDGYTFCHNSLTYQIATWDLETNKDYILRARAINGNGYDSSASVDIPFTVTEADIPESGILFTVSKTEVLTGEEIFYTVFAPGATQTRIWVERPGSDYHEIDDDSNSPVISGSHTWDYNPGEITYYAQAQFPGEDEPRTATIEGSVTAPYGKLQDELSLNKPAIVTPGNAFTATLTRNGTGEAIVPDRITVWLYNEEGSRNLFYKEIKSFDEGISFTIPAKQDDGSDMFEEGKGYRLSVDVKKVGWEGVYYNSSFYAVSPNNMENNRLTVNGSSADQTLWIYEPYSVEVSLPTDATAVSILNTYGYWDNFAVEAGSNRFSREYMDYSFRNGVTLLARYTTQTIGSNPDWNTVNWGKYTNPVNVSIACKHNETTELYEWAEGSAFKQVDEYQHTCTGTATKWLVCSKCSEKRVNLGIAHETITESHRYADGVCTVCGYECLHDAEDIVHETGLYDLESATLVTVTDEKEVLEGIGWSCDRCDHCGMQFNRVENTQVQAYRWHSYERYQENGETYSECMWCGHRCTHENKEVNGKQEPVISYARKDEHNHIKTTTQEEYSEYCPNCGLAKNVSYTSESENEAHADQDNNGVCDICGFSISGAWEWRIHDGMLIISGNGDISGFGSAETTPWYGRRNEITEIILGADITGIGANAFGGFENTVRISFNEETLPASIAENAFAGSSVICRYYSEDESWARLNQNNKYGAESIRWIYLPENTQENNQANTLYYYKNYSYGDEVWNGWRVHTGIDEYPVTREQALEYGFRRANIVLYAVPETQEDRDVYEKHWDTVDVFSIWFEDAGDAFTLSFPTGTKIHAAMSIHSPRRTVTIDASNVTDGLPTISLDSGNITITASRIRELFAGGMQDVPGGTVTINGTVGSLEFYNPSNREYNGSSFGGTLVVNGTIEEGHEYGVATAEIKNIGTIVIDGNLLNQFENVAQQTTPVIQNGVLNVPGVTPFEKLTEKNCRLQYSMSTMDGQDSWSLYAYPKGNGVSGIYIDDIYAYNPNFTIDQICWGEDTSLSLQQVTSQETVRINGKDGVGLGYLSVNGSNAEVNCPIRQVDIYEHREFTWENASTVTINSDVEDCNFHLIGKGSNMILGTNGKITDRGYLSRPLYDDLFFERVSTAGPILQNGQLKVLSHKRGQRISSILPSEDTLARAAGINEDQVAVMEMKDASLNAEEEAAVLETLEMDGNISAAFDVSIKAYESDSSDFVGDITTLNTAVPITVKNVTGEEVCVVRLHKNANGELSVARLTEPSSEATIPFESKLFSKYALVTMGTPLDLSKLKTLKLPANLTRIEANSFEGGAFEAVIIPDGCTSIGAGAFKNCKNLIYVSYPGGIRIEDGAFEGCTIRKRVER